MAICAVIGCNSNNDKRLKRNKTPNKRELFKFFRFPKDEVLRKVWFQKCGRGENSSVETPLVCSKHFLPEHFARNLQHKLLNYSPGRPRQLKMDAIPTEKLPCFPKICNMLPTSEFNVRTTELKTIDEHTIPETKAIQKQLPVVSTPKDSDDGILNKSYSSKPLNEREPKQFQQTKDLLTDLRNMRIPKKGDIAPFFPRDPNVENSSESESNASKASCIQQAVRFTQSVELQQELRSAKLVIEDLQLQIKKLETENASLKAEVAYIEQLFTPGQRRKMRSDRRVKWDVDDICKAISIYASGPKAYRLLLNRKYPFPAVSTLRRWASKVDTSPGYLSSVFALMRNASLSRYQKVCILMADEMKVQSAYEYDRKTDYLHGPANYTQVIMARGLFENWKQPVFYMFDYNLTETALKTVIIKLNSMEYDVVAVVSDLGGSNRGLWKKMQITESHPYFVHPCDANVKVYVFRDVPHLIKLLRNHFLDHGLILEEKRLTKEPLKELLEIQSQSELKIASRLTEHHLSVQRGERQKVKLATQLFSHTNACALDRMGALGIAKSNNWHEVSVLLKQVNDWFDVYNSKVPRIDFRHRMVAYGLEMQEHERILEDISTTMRSIRVGSHKTLLPFQRGILSNIVALKMLFTDLKTVYGAKYILTYRLNQDPLEMFFGVMRAKGGLHDHPTALQFRHRLRSYLLGRNEWIPSESSNVEKEMHDDSPIELCTTIFNTHATEGTRTLQEPDASLTSNLLSNLVAHETSDKYVSSTEDTSDEISDLEYDALEYIAGYILYRLKCHPKLLHFYSEHGPSTSFTWTNQITEGALRKPTSEFVAKLKLLENIFNKLNAESFQVGPNYIASLINLADGIDLHMEVKKLFFRCKMYFKIRIFNKLLVEKNKQKKRKLNKTVN